TSSAWRSPPSGSPGSRWTGTARSGGSAGSASLVVLARAPHKAAGLITHGPPGTPEEAPAQPRGVRSQHQQPRPALRGELQGRGEGAGGPDEHPLHGHAGGMGELGGGTERRLDLGRVAEVVVAEPHRHGQRRQLDDVCDDERLALFEGGGDGELGGALVEGDAEEGGKEDRPAVTARPGIGRPEAPELRGHVTRGAAASSGGCAPAAAPGGASAACKAGTTRP